MRSQLSTQGPGWSTAQVHQAGLAAQGLVHHHLDVAGRATVDQINFSICSGEQQLALRGVVGHIRAGEDEKTNPRSWEEGEGGLPQPPGLQRSSPSSWAPPAGRQ